ncbi:MAG: methyltransferase [Patescibacteria group bacterium]
MGKDKFEAKAATLPNRMGKDRSTLSYEEYLEGTRAILKKSQENGTPYIAMVAGREFLVYPNVFSPKYFNDTELFAEHLPVRKDSELLEIGPGTGAVSITALYKGAGRVVAIDINPDAVRNTQENIKKHAFSDKMDVREGDLYDGLKEGEKFDAIFWNTPFGLVQEPQLTDLEKAVWDVGYRSTERFVKEASQHLKPGGKLYIGFSSTLGKIDLLTKFAKEAGYRLVTIYEAESTEIHPVRFEIFEAIK